MCKILSLSLSLSHFLSLPSSIPPYPPSPSLPPHFSLSLQHARIHTVQIRSRRQATGGGAPTPHGDHLLGDLNQYASIYYSGNRSAVSTRPSRVLLTSQLLRLDLSFSLTAIFSRGIKV